MNIAKLTLTGIFTICLMYAQGAEGSGRASAAQAHDFVERSAAASSNNSADTTTNSEVFRKITVASGKTVSIDSTLDYSAASTVAITVLCEDCTTEATSLGTMGLTLQARWKVPDADSYVATESKAATAFAYWDAGGASFNVYGSKFQLTLKNKGTQGIVVQQITIMRRGG